MERALIAAGSVSVFEGPEEDAPLVTELIVGERLGVLDERDGWLRVVVPGHATGLDPRGYPGWARLDGLVEAPAGTPTSRPSRPTAPACRSAPCSGATGETSAFPTAAW